MLRKSLGGRCTTCVAEFFKKFLCATLPSDASVITPGATSAYLQ